MHFATKATLIAAATVAASVSLLMDTAGAAEVSEVGTPLLPTPGQVAPAEATPEVDQIARCATQ